MVDGVLASCYPSAHHDLAHIGMTPIRWFLKIFEWIFGDENGFQGYVRMCEELGMWVIPMEPVLWNQWFNMNSEKCTGGNYMYKLDNAEIYFITSKNLKRKEFNIVFISFQKVLHSHYVLCIL